MTSRDFCLWLQGFFELSGFDMTQKLNAKQVECIKKHLSLVFLHEIDPSAGPQAHQDELNAAHSGYPAPVSTSEVVAGPLHGPALIRC